MKRCNIGYYVREGVGSINRHGFMSFAAIGIIAACLIIMGSFGLIALNLEHNLARLMEENEFLAYVDENYSEEEARALEVDIESIPNVKETTFVTRAEAMDNYLDTVGNGELYEDLPPTVLRDRYSIRVDDIEQLESTINAVSDIEGIAKVSAAVDVANGFVTMRNVFAAVAVIMVAILVVVSLFIISNAIKLATFSRQEEIAIMKMVGATNGFIRWPFVFEGIVLGTLSALIAMLLQWGVYELIVQAVAMYSRVNFISLVSFVDVAPYVAVLYGGIGLVVGVFGSLITIRKFLRV